MHPNVVVPLLVLVVIPVGYLASRLGLLRRPRARLLGAVVAAGVLLASVPAGGLDFAHLKRLNLFIAMAVVLLLLLRHRGIGWAAEPRRYLAALAGLAAASVVVYLNFFSFHGDRTWVHYHDVTHYYLGAKYFRELGYRHLYAAMLRAEWEESGRLIAHEARDLETGEIVSAALLLERSEAARAAFDVPRWAAFAADVAFLRAALGPHYPAVLRDHGFNATPFWALLGGLLAERVPPGSHRGILLLTLIDPLLLLVAFAAVYRAFGAEALALAVLDFCLLYGATFGWVGGAFLRYAWFFALLLAISCLRGQRYRLAGGLLAVSALLRIFPAFFVAGFAVRAVAGTAGDHRPAASGRRVVTAFVATASTLFVLTTVAQGGLAAWIAFTENIAGHAVKVAPNLVGLPFLITGAGPPDVATRIAVGASLVVAAVLTALLGRREGDEVDLAALGVLLVFAGLNLAGYYYVFLVLLVLSRAGRRVDLALVFGVEALTYALLLFEEREGVLYAYRSLLLLYLLAALHRDAIADAARRARAWLRREPAPTGASRQGP